MPIFSFLKREQTSGAVEYIIAGLGNPGREYEGTRHNAGFETVDRIAASCGAEIKKAKFDSLCADAFCGGHRVLLIKPQTNMNHSGKAVSAAARFYKIPPERVIILCDDVNLDVGRIRVRRRGSDGGQNGLKDIISKIGDGFPRIRVGVGRPPEPGGLVSWVLGKIPEELQPEYRAALDRASEAAVFLLENGFEKTMSRYN